MGERVTLWQATLLQSNASIYVHAPRWFDARAVASRHFGCSPEISVLLVASTDLDQPPVGEPYYQVAWKGNAARRVNNLQMEVTKR